MCLKECYNALGGDYNDVLRHLGSEKLVEKFVLKFPEDDSFSKLTDALKEKNLSEAFRAAHTIKGISLNLSFTSLFEPASGVTEALRNNDLEEALRLFPQLEAGYHHIVSVITQYRS